MKLSKAQNKVIEILKNPSTVAENLFDNAKISWHDAVYIKSLGVTRFSSKWSGSAFKKTLEVLVREGLVEVERVNYDYSYDRVINNGHDLAAATCLDIQVKPASENAYEFYYHVKLIA